MAQSGYSLGEGYNLTRLLVSGGGGTSVSSVNAVVFEALAAVII